MRAIAPAVQALDRLLVRLYDLRSVSGEGRACGDDVLRVRTRRLSAPMRLGGKVVPAGSRVLELHLCNEAAGVPATRADSATWALHLLVRYRRSCRRLAARMRVDPDLAVEAIGGRAGFFGGAGGHGGAARLPKRLGFTVVPHRPGGAPLFLQRLYAWSLMAAYAPGSLVGRRWTDVTIIEFWMTRRAFLERFAPGR
jgi:hypothetical protein